MAQTALEHAQVLDEVKQRQAQEHKDENSKLKEKYLGALKSMRKDFERSKEESKMRLESEWSRRREKLDEEWKQKLDGAKSNYEQEVRRLKNQLDDPIFNRLPPLSVSRQKSRDTSARTSRPATVLESKPLVNKSSRDRIANIVDELLTSRPRDGLYSHSLRSNSIVSSIREASNDRGRSIYPGLHRQ